MNQEILSSIQNNPQAMRAVEEAIQELLQDQDIDRDSIDQLVRMLEFVMQNPDSYNEFRQTAIQGGMLDPEDLPEQFNPDMLTIVLLALKVVQQQMTDGGPGFARGGLNKIAQMGRRGDSELAHINPFERRLLESYGGSGTINPRTGLREFKWLKKLFKKLAPLLPIALSIFAPGIGTALGSMLSGGALAGTAAGMLGGAAVGGLSSAASGGNFVKGAIGGALGAGAGGALGGAIGDATGMTLSNTAQNVLGSSLIGGAQSVASGGDFLTGAVQGGVGGYAGSTLSGAAGGISGKLGAGLQTAGQQFGNALTMGADPKQALAQGALSGLAAAYQAPSAPAPKSIYDITPAETGGIGLKAPSDLVIERLKVPQVNTSSVPEIGLSTNYSLTSGSTPTFSGPSSFAPDYSLAGPATAGAASSEPYTGTGIQASPLNTIAAQTTDATPTASKPAAGTANKGFSLGNAAAMLPLLSMFGSAQTPEEVQQVVSQMTPEQQEYFNRPMRNWNWDTLSAAAKMQNLPVGSYIARNWDKVGGGMYDNPAEEPTQNLAFGGFVQRARKKTISENGFDLSSNGMWRDRGTGAEMSTKEALEWSKDPFRKKLYSGLNPSQNVQPKQAAQNFDWSKINDLSKQSGISPSQFLARNWGGGIPTVQMARGGALTRLARGGGSGRDDTISARLSDGEYVMDAETVALLGDGSTDAGARRLDEMRAKIRQHKGKSMARGKFSANAKSPLAYLKGA